jgi:uncharacterized protein YfdQ (DUF2303 family)
MSKETLTLDSAATIDALQNLCGAASAIKHVGEATFIVSPAEFEVHEITSALDRLAPHPRRKQGTIVLLDLDSFIACCKYQNSAPCRIYADPCASALTAVFNDHSDQAGWRDFRAVYVVEHSRELDVWMKHDKNPMEQEEFAVFLEDNVADIVEPSGEIMLAMALTLQAKTEANFQSSRRLDNGQVQLHYTETIDARAGAGQLEIPREFAIGIRLFKNGEGYRLRARLKYRVGGGKVKFWYELDRPENAIDDAFADYVGKVRDAGFDPLLGRV